jgi:O-antigen/teichoic acid export membrane protein
VSGAGSRHVQGQVARLLLHFLVPAVSAAAPLAVIPAVTSRFGAPGWSAVAVGMSVGIAAAVVAELGWSIVGPVRIARDPAARAAVFARALASKLVATTVLLPVVVVVTASVVDRHALAAVLVAVGVALGALSPTWYFVGLGRPGRIVLTEALPRVAFALTAAIAVWAGAPLEAYGACLVLAVAATSLLTPVVDDAARFPSRQAFAEVPLVVREQAVLVLGRAVTTTYKSLPVALLGASSPASVAAFAAADRPLRMGLQVLSAVPDRLQTWVGTPDVDLARRRSLVSLAVNVVLGTVAGSVFAVAMPAVSVWLFAGAVDVGRDLAVAGGVLVAVICASRGAGLALVSAGRQGHTTTAAIAAALVGVPGVLAAGAVAGATGAVAALVLAEAVGLLVQLALLVGTGRRAGSSGLVRTSVAGASS